MGDFLLDFRKKPLRNPLKVINLMKYYPDMKVNTFDFDAFTLSLSRPDDMRIWGSYLAKGEDLFVALAGRIALESTQWDAALDISGEGGLACKAICKLYKSNGVENMNLNGNFVVIIYDIAVQKVFVITDRCGMFPCFEVKASNNEFMIGSHPDILASVAGSSNEWDLTSMAEFLISGKVSYPYSYYNNVRALHYGSIYTINFEQKNDVTLSYKPYFNFHYNIDTGMSEWQLAEELAAGFKKSIRRRTMPLFGQTVISLSGGLDSRALLCAADDKINLWTVCFFDEENLEYKIAKDIAKEAGVKIIPFQRAYDHYGDNAEMGVRISGGMGDFGSNHYLGFRDTFVDHGMNNVIAGFYCDYLFKGLVLDKKNNKLLRTERLSKFTYENYMPLYWFNTKYTDIVKARMNETFSEILRNDESELGKLRIEEKRLFPLCYEPDNEEAIVPQRVMGWYLPIVDNDIIDTYLKVPPKYKLNTSMYAKMVELLCGKNISNIMNINTGAKVNANRASIIFHAYQMAIQRRLRKHAKRLATDESWPNWSFYLHNSKKIEEMWTNKNDIALDVLLDIVGKDSFKTQKQDYTSGLKLFLRLLTLKIWISQRL